MTKIKILKKVDVKKVGKKNILLILWKNIKNIKYDVLFGLLALKLLGIHK